MRKATFPRMGPYTEAFAYIAKQLGFEPIIPPKTSQQTIKLGVRHSSNMMCYPFKVTFGNLIEGLEAGADTIIVLGVAQNNKTETCRMRFYYHIQEQLLKRLGYKFDMHYIRGPGWKIFLDLKKINPNLSYWKIWTIIRGTYKYIKEIENKHFRFKHQKINIGIIGEAFTLWENDINYNIVDKLQKMGIGVDLSLKLSWWLTHQVDLADEKKYLHEKVKKYFPKHIGGHGYESICNAIYYAENGFDGIIHLLPLSCMPESTVEMVIGMIGDDYGIPVYRFPIDENQFEAGFNTRLETFIKLLKRQKNAQ